MHGSTNLVRSFFSEHLQYVDDQFGDDSGSQSEGEMTYESTDLFRGRRVVVIQHGGESYRLIETRNGKLILQK